MTPLPKLEAKLVTINAKIRKHQDAIDDLREERKPIQEAVDKLKRESQASRRAARLQGDVDLLKEFVRGATVKELCAKHGGTTTPMRLRIERAWRMAYKAHWRATLERNDAIPDLKDLRESPPLV